MPKLVESHDLSVSTCVSWILLGSVPVLGMVSTLMMLYNEGEWEAETSLNDMQTNVTCAAHRHIYQLKYGYQTELVMAQPIPSFTKIN